MEDFSQLAFIDIHGAYDPVQYYHWLGREWREFWVGEENIPAGALITDFSAYYTRNGFDTKGYLLEVLRKEADNRRMLPDE